MLRRPLGVVAAIVPWNFPTTLLCNKLGPALLAGNTVVAKPADTTPLTTLRLAEIFHEAGLPAGVFNVLPGTGAVAGEALVHAPAACARSPSPARRRSASASHALAAVGSKRVTLELGGSDPMIICDDADLKAAASAAAMGRFYNCGQACLAIKRLYVFESVADEVIEAVAAKAKRLRVGIGSDPDSPARPDAHREASAASWSARSPRAAARSSPAAGARRAWTAAGSTSRPSSLEPGRDSPMAREEVFGPALPIWRVKDLDEAIELANDSPFGLGSSRVDARASTPPSAPPPSSTAATRGSTRRPRSTTSCRSAA